MNEVRELLQQVESVAVLLEKIETADLAHAVIAFTKYLQERGKTVGIIIKDKLSSDIDQVFKDNKIVYTDTVTPLRYLVSIDYGNSNIEKVLHDIDEENQKVEFCIVPSGKEFDFDNVTFSQEGDEYDLTVVFDLENYQDLGKLYEKAEHLFRNNEVIGFVGHGVEQVGDKTLFLRDGQTYSSLMRALIGREMTDDIRELLIGGILEEVNILEGDVTEDEFDDVYEAVKSGADFNEILRNKYYSKSYKNLNLQLKLMSNVQIDKDERIIWSIINHEDVKFAGVNRKTLDTKGRILFNISDDFDLALAVYEVEEHLFKVVIESNNSDKYSAKRIAEIFNGRGGNSHAVCVIDNTSRKDIEDVLFRAIKSLYGIETGISDDADRADAIRVNDDEDSVIDRMSRIAKEVAISEVDASESVPSDSDMGEPTEISLENLNSSDAMKPLTIPASDDITTFEELSNPVVAQDAELDHEDLLD